MYKRQEELSQKKNFIGIQKVLVEEINNSDSKKYAILTTTDSFYRYKEAVKELVSQILRENDQKREQLVKERTGLVEGTVTSKRNQYRLEYCESASQLVYQVCLLYTSPVLRIPVHLYLPVLYYSAALLLPS